MPRGRTGYSARRAVVVLDVAAQVAGPRARQLVNRTGMLEGVKTSPAIRAVTGLPLTVKVMLSPTARPAAARKAELASTSCGPWYRLGQVAMEAVRASANGHAQPAVLPSRHQPLRHREGVGEMGPAVRPALGSCPGPTHHWALFCLPVRAAIKGAGQHRRRAVLRLAPRRVRWCRG